MWTTDAAGFRAGFGVLLVPVLLVPVLLVSVLLVLVLLAPAPSRAQPAKEPAEVQLERLRDALQSWSHGHRLSHDQVKAVFSADADPRDGRVKNCIRRVESDFSSYLEEQDPSLLPILAFWQAQMLLSSMDWAEQGTLRAVDFDRIQDRLKSYRKKAPDELESLTEEQAERNTVLAWTGLAELFSRRGSTAFYLSAERVLERALEIDRSFRPARYLQAWVGEKVHEPLDMMRPWRELSEEVPENDEYRLRFALNAIGAARHEAALEALETVARGDDEAWLRVLAYEEWIQLLLEEADPEDAAAQGRVRELLAEARRELPGWPGLDLLAAHLHLEDDRRTALRLAEQVEAHVWGDAILSPRLRYEIPDEGEIGPARAELVELLEAGRRDLGAYLFFLDSEAILSGRSRRACS